MKVEVRAIIRIPDLDRIPTEEEIKEWIQFRTGYTNSCKTKNPLVDEDIEAIRIEILEFIK